MECITRFEQMTAWLRSRPRRCRIAAVWPDDDHSLEALRRALAEGMADVLLCGRAERYAALSADFGPRAECLSADTPVAAARVATAAVRAGRADLIFKGLIASDDLLRALLDKTGGLLPPGGVLAHVAAAEVPGRQKLLLLSDVAVIPQPTLEQRRAQVGYLADVCRRLGTERPRIALLHCTEKVSEKFPLTSDYRILCREALDGRWGDMEMEGPMDLTSAIRPQAAAVKQLSHALGGEADALLMPDIEAGNVLYKALPLWCGARVAGMVMGAACPVVLTSRADTAQAKFDSLALAALTAAR